MDGIYTLMQGGNSSKPVHGINYPYFLKKIRSKMRNVKNGFLQHKTRMEINQPIKLCIRKTMIHFLLPKTKEMTTNSPIENGTIRVIRV